VAPEEELSVENADRLVEELKKYDAEEKYSKEMDKELGEIALKLVSLGEAAVPGLIEVLEDDEGLGVLHAMEALGKIGDERAIAPLVDLLENPDIGSNAGDALLGFGAACVPEVIRKMEHRIAHPVEDKGAFILLTTYHLRTIGDTRCDRSIEFLNGLLDEYMSEMPRETFDPSKLDWKYRNVDFFQILDAMVKQQDERAIGHIENARDAFPPEYVDHKICQVAIDRIRSGDKEGYLPMEAIEMAVPTEAIMDAFRGAWSLGDLLDDAVGESSEEEWDEEEWRAEDAEEYEDVYQFRVSLKGAKPPIWRRIQVPGSYTFWDLHSAIQDAMGWDDYHMHAFEIFDPSVGAVVVIGGPSGDPDGFGEDIPGWKTAIADYFSPENSEAKYEYDFGDSWMHRVKLDKILPREENLEYPRCIAGKRACPPEDCGGVWGYIDLLEIINDPQHEEHEEMLEWVGEDFDPEDFSPDGVFFGNPRQRLEFRMS